MVRLLLAVAYLLVSERIAQAEVVSYPLASCYAPSEQFHVAVDSVAIPVLANSAIYEYGTFSFSGTVTVTIKAQAAIQTYNISPKSLAIPATVQGDTLRFTLQKSAYLIVKIDNLHELVLAADDLERDVPRPSGLGIYNVTQPPYAADGTGATPATGAVQAAIDAASASGKGTVYVPAGVYRCGNLVLKSNVTLYLAGGAVLRASDNPADFTTFYRKSSVKMNGTWFIYTAPDAHNVTIRGRGTLDGNGNGTYLRQKRQYLTDILVPMHCSDFTLDGIILHDSGLWGLIPTRSNHITIRNTKHFNENDLNLEDDAMDIQECQDVTVTHTIAISEDDTYSTKTWGATTDIAAHWPGMPEPLARVTFDDCVAWSRCATFKLGFGNVQPQSDVTFKNSCSYRSMRAIAINHRWGDTPAERITVDNIDVEGFWPRKGSQSRWLEITCDSPGPLHDVTIENCNVRTVGSTLSVLRGHDAAGTLSKVTFRHNTVNGAPATTLDALHVAPVKAFVEEVEFRE